MENGILVIEVFDRSIQSVTPCESLEEAVEAANDLLHEHAKGADKEDEFLAGDEEGWGRATAENCYAWANWSGFEWDAHIVQF